VIDVEAAVELGPQGARLVRAALGRTARRLMEGYAFVPWSTLS
jgi:2-methylaconitate cis-trans-isomerase PrpF